MAINPKIRATFYAMVSAAREGRLNLVEARSKASNKVFSVLTIETDNGQYPIGRLHEPTTSLYYAPDPDADTVCGCDDCLQEVIEAIRAETHIIVVDHTADGSCEPAPKGAN